LIDNHISLSKFACAIGSITSENDDPDCVIFECQEAVNKCLSNHQCWTRTDNSSKAVLTTKKEVPELKHVHHRITKALSTDEVIEDVRIDKWCSDIWLHRPLPRGVVGTSTLLYHNDPNLKQFGCSTVGATHAENTKGVSADMLEKVWRIDKDTAKRTGCNNSAQ